MVTGATGPQIELMRQLYKELGQEPEENIENLSKEEASKIIDELLEMKKKIFDPPDDGKYWY